MPRNIRTTEISLGSLTSTQDRIHRIFYLVKAMASYVTVAHMCIFQLEKDLWVKGREPQLFSPELTIEWVRDYWNHGWIMFKFFWSTRIHSTFNFMNLMQCEALQNNVMYYAVRSFLMNASYLDSISSVDMLDNYSTLIHYLVPPNIGKLKLAQPVPMRDVINEMGFGPNSVMRCVTQESMPEFTQKYLDQRWNATNLNAVEL